MRDMDSFPPINRMQTHQALSIGLACGLGVGREGRRLSPAAQAGGLRQPLRGRRFAPTTQGPEACDCRSGPFLLFRFFFLWQLQGAWGGRFVVVFGFGNIGVLTNNGKIDIR